MRKKVLWLVFIVALVCLPLAAPGIEGRWGQDLGFHLMRIEGIAEGLENGVFPVKMQGLWMEGYGYPVSVYYGDFLLYIPALLRLCGVPVVAAYKIFVALVNLGTGLLALYSFRKIFGDDRVALVCAAAYLTAGYRLLNLYVRAAAGEYCAMMFLPLLAAAVWEIYRGKPAGIRERFSMATLLALALSGLIGTHLLTTEMAGVVLLIVGLIFWKRTFSREVFPTLALACGETALLNLYFLVPFLDYYLHVPVYLNRVMEGVKQIQEDGASLFQLLAFWASPFQRGDASTHLIATPGPLLGGTGRRTDPFVPEKTDEADPALLARISGASSGVHLLFSLGFSGREQQGGPVSGSGTVPLAVCGAGGAVSDADAGESFYPGTSGGEGADRKTADWSGGNTDRENAEKEQIPSPSPPGCGPPLRPSEPALCRSVCERI